MLTLKLVVLISIFQCILGTVYAHPFSFPFQFIWISFWYAAVGESLPIAKLELSSRSLGYDPERMLKVFQNINLISAEGIQTIILDLKNLVKSNPTMKNKQRYSNALAELDRMKELKGVRYFPLRLALAEGNVRYQMCSNFPLILLVVLTEVSFMF